MQTGLLTPQALAVLEKRYLLRDAQGRVIESPEEMFRRVARNVAEAERLYANRSSIEELSESFFRMMASLDFLPNSPCPSGPVWVFLRILVPPGDEPLRSGGRSTFLGGMESAGSDGDGGGCREMPDKMDSVFSTTSSVPLVP